MSGDFVAEIRPSPPFYCLTGKQPWIFSGNVSQGDSIERKMLLFLSHTTYTGMAYIDLYSLVKRFQFIETSWTHSSAMLPFASGL